MDWIMPDAAGELFGQDDLNLAILFTCRLYNEEGWKILFTENSFSFDLDWSIWVSPTTSKVPWLWFNGFLNITSLNFRVISTPNDGDFVKITIDRVLFLEEFRALRSFRLDFVTVMPALMQPTRQAIQYRNTIDLVYLDFALEPIKGLMQSKREGETLDKNNSWVLGGAEHKLDKVILTGLLDNDLHLLMIKYMSLLLKPGGRLEIAKGAGGKRYKVSPGLGNLVMMREPQRYTLVSGEVQSYTERHRAPAQFEWARFFKWEDFE